MTELSVQTSIRLPVGSVEKLDEIGTRIGCHRGTLIRRAVEEFIARELDPTAYNRMAMLAEFSQLALDTLVRDHVPDKHQEILQTVKRRMETFHAAR